MTIECDICGNKIGIIYANLNVLGARAVENLEHGEVTYNTDYQVFCNRCGKKVYSTMVVNEDEIKDIMRDVILRKPNNTVDVDYDLF